MFFRFLLVLYMGVFVTNGMFAHFFPMEDEDLTELTLGGEEEEDNDLEEDNDEYFLYPVESTVFLVSYQYREFSHPQKSRKGHFDLSTPPPEQV